MPVGGDALPDPDEFLQGEEMRKNNAKSCAVC